MIFEGYFGDYKINRDLNLGSRNKYKYLTSIANIIPVFFSSTMTIAKISGDKN